jgi:hypothetical protein
MPTRRLPRGGAIQAAHFDGLLGTEACRFSSEPSLRSSTLIYGKGTPEPLPTACGSTSTAFKIGRRRADTLLIRQKPLKRDGLSPTKRQDFTAFSAGAGRFLSVRFGSNDSDTPSTAGLSTLLWERKTWTAISQRPFRLSPCGVTDWLIRHSRLESHAFLPVQRAPIG